jgi:hypothetical protein
MSDWEFKEGQVMDVLWMGLIIFAVIVASFIITLGLTKGVALATNSGKKDKMPSHWVVRQVYSGDDTLGHPDLKKISELQEMNELSEGTENI